MASIQFCTFHITGSLFGINILDVKEIQIPTVFTPVLHAGGEVRGLVNIRGQVHLVIDLRVLLGFDREKVGKSHRIVLLKPHVGESFGILVDSVGDVAELHEDEIEQMNGDHAALAESGLRGSPELIKGIGKLRSSLLMVLNAKALLEKVEKIHNRG